jgi:hypothetical protein
VLLWVFGVIGGVLLLFVLVCGGAIWYVSSQVRRAAERADEIRRNQQQGQFNEVPFVNVDDALNQLRFGDVTRKRSAARWLGRTQFNPADQARVVQALEAATRDGDVWVRHEAQAALPHWRR